MLRLLHRYVILPGYETLYQRRKIFRYYADLERTQWLSPKELEALHRIDKDGFWR